MYVGDGVLVTCPGEMGKGFMWRMSGFIEAIEKQNVEEKSK